MLSSFLTPFSSSALTLSLPSIGAEFASGPDILAWILSAYLVTSALCLLPMGKAADLYGKRRIYLLGLAGFTATNVIGALAGGVGALIVMRALQGFFASMLFATGMAILTLVVPKERRGFALGANVSVVYLGLATGPFLGGFINYYLGWRSIFVLITCLSAIAWGLARRYLAQEWITGGGHPMLPFHLLRTNREFRLSNLTAMVNYSATFAVSFLLSLYLQDVLGLSSREAGLILLLQPVVMAALSPACGHLSDKLPARLLVSLGMGLIACALLGLAAILRVDSLPFVAVLILVLGAGIALFNAPNNNAIMSCVDPADYSLATATLSAVRLLGQFASTLIVSGLLAIPWAAAPIENLRFGIAAAFVTFAVLSAAGIGPSLARKAHG
ncbi:MFS transporter [uncultured Selenomonas sp.]|uniref:MFS transporter n=1 Tax=uncultured Selenomonas sp. TaxID=159275 RepID=UPI0025DBC2C4|nr:MFS transporter [uncultured Selenomonas sp.]